MPNGERPTGMGPGARVVDNLISILANIPKGVLGIDPTPEEEEDYRIGPSINKLIQIGLAGKDFAGATGAALPLAVPRKLHRSIIQEFLDKHHQDFSSDYRKLIGDWTGGSAMMDRRRNLEMAEKFRNSPEDTAKVQEILRRRLGTDRIPAFRGVREDEINQLREYYQQGIDPGARSFSLEPKVTHKFADSRIPWSIPGADTTIRFDTTHPGVRRMRMENGQLYRADVPIENVLGYGTIPGQRELIIDLKGLNPDEQLKVLRSNNPRPPHPGVRGGW